MANSNDSEMIAAAILAAGFTAAQRQSISSGRTEDALREKYIEFLAFVREQNSPPGKKKK
jgi:hypothetical protein